MDYNGINAKIKTMQGKLLGPTEYDALSHLGSVGELGLKLKTHPIYQRSLLGLDEIRRQPIEQKVVLSLHEDFQKLIAFIWDHKVRMFLRAYFQKNDIYIIKSLLCMATDERSYHYSLPELADLLRGHPNIDVKRLTESKSTNAFIQNLLGSVFHQPLADAYSEDIPLAALEARLDLYYYKQLWQAAKKYLDKANFAIARHLVGTEADMRNIMWMYRLKTFYDVPVQQIRSFIIPVYYRLRARQLIQMSEIRNTDELKTFIANTCYGKYFPSLGSNEPEIEKDFYRAMLREHRVAERRDARSLAVAMRFIFLKELEIQNVISLAEGLRYGLQPAGIMEYLIVRRDESV